VTGTTTGETQVDGIVTVAGTVTNELAATVTTTDDGTEAITVDGTLSGTSVHDTTTAPDSDEMVMRSAVGRLETHEIGTTTGETMVDGMVKVAGTVTNDEAGTVTMIENGIEAITPVGTESGTFSHETITAPDWDGMVMMSDDGKNETQSTGTTTGVKTEVGTTTSVGTKTNEETGMVTTAVAGTVKMTVSGTDDGTLV